jgi:pantetheine-phosphate adenylyltransferase
MRIGGIETVILFSKPENSSISSSAVRELAAYGKDVSALLP